MAFNRRRVLKAVGASGIGISLAGCIGGDEDQGAGEIPDLVNLGYPSPAHPVYNYAVIPSFRDRMEDEHGVETEWSEFSGFTELSAGLIQEEALMGSLTPETVAEARAEGMPLVGIYGKATAYDFAIIVDPEIDSWDDLRGESFASHSPSSQSDVVTRGIAEAELGDADEIDIDYIPGTPSRLAALESGEVAGTVVFLSGALQAVEDGYAELLSVPWEYDLLENNACQFWVTLETTLEENEDTIGEMLEHMGAAYDEMYEADPEEINELALESGTYTEFDDDVWLEAYEQAIDVEMWQGEITDEQVENVMDAVTQTGLLDDDQRLSRDELIDDRFM